MVPDREERRKITLIATATRFSERRKPLPLADPSRYRSNLAGSSVRTNLVKEDS